MTRLALSAGWRSRILASVSAPPRRPREALFWRGERIGSVEPDLFARAGLLHRVQREGAAWHIGAAGRGCPPGDAAAGLEELAALAQGLHAAGLTQSWRDELLAVRNEAGVVLGAIERGAARPLGIATVAVHLLAVDPEGRHWVQQRAFDKDTDPGMWDTLVGGLVPAGEPPPAALARETWEEAGLRPQQLRDLRHGGTFRMRGPAGLAHGYVVQDLEWFTCTLPAGVQPSNQDGEVAGFALLAPGELVQRLEQGAFTRVAGILYLEAFGRAA